MIFNYYSNGEAEVKKVLGTTWKSLSYEEFEPFLRSADRDLKRMLTAAIYNLGETHYQSGDYNNSGNAAHLKLRDDFVYWMQMVVAKYAYCKFAPGKDLARSANGRKFIAAEDEKIPSDRFLKRDDEYLLNLAHESTDRLLEFLEDNKNVTYNNTEDPPVAVLVFPGWKTSTTYLARLDLFVPTLEDFENVFPINNSYRLYHVLVPLMLESQKFNIKSLLTITKYDEIIASLKSTSPSAEALEIKELAATAVVYNALALAVKRLILPTSFFQKATLMEGMEFNEHATANEMYSSILKILKDQGDIGLAALSEYMRKAAATLAGTEYTVTSLADRIDTTLKHVRF